MFAYRSDIDGLRALAVLAVIVFHANASWLPGGYAGVDVFFVISGYLIASITLGELARGSFSLASFYERRVRRIFPPLVAVLLATSVAGYFLLLPSEFKELGRTLGASALFWANFFFWKTSGYFAPAAESNALLHTWSLAVEEQYYVVFPLLMMALHRSRRALLSVTALLAICSFGLSVWGVRAHETLTFYGPHTRAWELLVGALLAMGVVPKRDISGVARNAIALVGLSAVCAAFVGFDEFTRFPGESALVPCLGAAALIYAGESGTSLPGKWLSHRVPVSIGLVSYGLYLWHWPLLSFAQKIANGKLSGLQVACVLLLTLLLTLLSYFTLEKAVRTRLVLPTRRAAFAGTFASLLLCWGLSTYVDTKKGLPERVPDAVAKLDKAASVGGVRHLLKAACNGSDRRWGCKIGADKPKPSFLVWGDSHAASVALGLGQAARAAGRTGLLYTQPGCSPVERIRLPRRGAELCQRFRSHVYESMKRHKIRDVVLVTRWAMWTDGRRYGNELGRGRILRDAATPRGSFEHNAAVMQRGVANVLRTLRAKKANVTIVLPVPELRWLLAKTMARTLWFDSPLELRPTQQEHLLRQRGALAMFDALKKDFPFETVDPSKLLCDGEYCDVERGNKPLYIDNNHLTREGSRLLEPIFQPVFKKKDSPPIATAQGG